MTQAQICSCLIAHSSTTWRRSKRALSCLQFPGRMLQRLPSSLTSTPSNQRVSVHALLPKSAGAWTTKHPSHSKARR